MQPLQIDENTEMNYLNPTVLQDGNFIGLSPAGNGQILYYQVRKQTGQHIDKLDVVAAISIANVEDLKNFRDAISQVLDEHAKHEK